MSSEPAAIRLADFARLIARAISVFGTHERAVAWLEAANPALGGQTPLHLIETSADGAQKIEEELDAIEHGIAA